jgi:SAM-dependent methyltransferase
VYQTQLKGKMQHLPYFDFLFARISTEPILQELFRDHVHWGLFDSAPSGAVSIEAFSQATEELSRTMVSLLDLTAGMNVLDVGCGFGGTSRLIANAWKDVRVTGLNIDSRQVARARQLTTSDRVCFVEGDACCLPFQDKSFDRLIAVESVFHFPSRIKFLHEACRVLKADGILVLSDFLLNGSKLLPLVMKVLVQGNPIERFYGRINTTTATGYRLMAFMSGLLLVDLIDVTNKTLPTYTFLKQLARDNNEMNSPPDLANKFMEELAQRDQLRYVMLKFCRRTEARA